MAHASMHVLCISEHTSSLSAVVPTPGGGEGRQDGMVTSGDTESRRIQHYSEMTLKPSTVSQSSLTPCHMATEQEKGVQGSWMFSRPKSPIPARPRVLMQC